MERLKEEAKQEERKSGDRVGGRKERSRDQKKVLDRVSSEVLEDFSPTSEVESVGVSFGFSVRVFAVLRSVFVLSILAMWIVGYCLIRIVKLLSRRPFLSRNAKRFLREVKKT